MAAARPKPKVGGRAPPQDQALLQDLRIGDSVVIPHADTVDGRRRAYYRINCCARRLWGPGGYSIRLARNLGETVVTRKDPAAAKVTHG